MARSLPILFILLVSPIIAQGQKDEKAPDPSLFFRITVVDDETGRGVPLVKLTTMTNTSCYSDSAGVAAFYEPSLMNRKVFFHVESHGYEFPKDGFGQRGRTLDVAPGGSAVLKIKRINIAQRLYRITGNGIYRDSILLGDAAPIRHPLDNAGVMGQDTAMTAIYRGRLFWIWGDTTNIRYPIAANFRTTAARSDLPDKGGLDPEVGINLDYFREGDFVKPMVPLPNKSMYWLNSLFVAKDKAGTEHLLADYAEVKAPMNIVGRGLVEFDDEKEVFQEIRKDPVDPLIPTSLMPSVVEDGGKTWFYFFQEVLSRTPTTYEDVIDPKTHEAFTCLKDGCRFDGSAEQLDRAADGTLRWAWRRGASPIGPKEMDKLVKAGHMKPDECRMRLVDIETGKDVAFHRGAMAYNPYRKRWIMIACQVQGTSALGEIWYAEADAPTGPWRSARKILTHDQYTFYNPIQHPYFAKEGGRFIFFEGTYTKMFSGNKVATPRYDYNQVMHMLDLADPRLRPPR
ncbi:MAG: hypothetical protein AB1696_18280 [Planctomycetota bacterium]